MNTSTGNNLDNFTQALLEARKMQDDWLKYGVNFVDLYVEDIDSDWLDTWGNDEEEENESFNQIWVNTSQWLRGIFSQGWQSLESLLTENQLNFAPSLRSQQEVLENNQVKATKLINIENYQVALVISYDVVEQGKIAVSIQLYSLKEDSFLPPNLELTLLDEEDNLVQEPVISREQDNIVQLKRFKVLKQTKVTIKLQLEQQIILENLIINL
jgi:hypothetical protein